MSRSEFRWNKRRKHYSYLHKDDGDKRINILISSKPCVKRKGKKILKNVHLHKHPNKDKNGKFYVIPRNFVDDKDSFDEKIYKWSRDRNDKRKIKRIKKNKSN